MRSLCEEYAKRMKKSRKKEEYTPILNFFQFNLHAVATRQSPFASGDWQKATGEWQQRLSWYQFICLNKG